MNYRCVSVFCTFHNESLYIVLLISDILSVHLLLAAASFVATLFFGEMFFFFLYLLGWKTWCLKLMFCIYCKDILVWEVDYPVHIYYMSR